MSHGKVGIKWTDALQFVGTDSGNHSVVISSHDEENHSGMRPSDLLLLALGSCSAYDVLRILDKNRARLSRLNVEVKADQSQDPPFAFKKIYIHYLLSGKSLNEISVRQAIQLSLDKYCSVAATIRGVAEIEHSFELITIE